jgi:segregation and condensation protein B
MFGRKGVKRIEAIEPEPSSNDVAEEAEGFSLEELGHAYTTALMQSTTDANKATEQASILPEASAQEPNEESSSQEELLDAPVVDETDGVPLRPESILEAVLFLGTSNSQAIGVAKLVELFRNLSADEIDQYVDDLNDSYVKNNRAFEIAKEGSGYRFQLAKDLSLVRDRFYGKQKESQLNQAAIDCLSLVAYQPGITRENLEKQWNQPAGAMLGTLIRKGLIRIEKSESNTLSETQYYTTNRFLEIIGLDSLEDLPLAEDV